MTNEVILMRRDNLLDNLSSENSFRYSDESWMKYRKNSFNVGKNGSVSMPVNIYEIDLGCFIRQEEGHSRSSLLKDVLPSYLKKMGYTHLGLLADLNCFVNEMKFNDTFDFLAFKDSFRTSNELKDFINTLHNSGFGVLLDISILPPDLSNSEIKSRFISSLISCISKYHFDGISFNALGNCDNFESGKTQAKDSENAILELYSELYKVLTEAFSDIIFVFDGFNEVDFVEEHGAPRLIKNRNLTDTLFNFVSSDFEGRRKMNLQSLLFVENLFSQKNCISVSFNDVSVGKGSLIGKINGVYEDKFKLLRLLTLLLVSFPGKKLTFMGSEFAGFKEYDTKGVLEWFLLDYSTHSDYREYVQALNHFYLNSPELYELDFSEKGFETIDFIDQSLIIAFKRYALGGEYSVVLLNFSSEAEKIILPMEKGRELSSVFNTIPSEDINIKYMSLDGGNKLVAELELRPLFGCILKTDNHKKQFKV